MAQAAAHTMDTMTRSAVVGAVENWAMEETDASVPRSVSSKRLAQESGKPWSQLWQTLRRFSIRTCDRVGGKRRLPPFARGLCRIWDGLLVALLQVRGFARSFLWAATSSSTQRHRSPPVVVSNPPSRPDTAPTLWAKSDSMRFERLGEPFREQSVVEGCDNCLRAGQNDGCGRKRRATTDFRTIGRQLSRGTRPYTLAWKRVNLGRF